MKKEDVNTILAEIHKIKSEERRHLSEINYKSILAGKRKCHIPKDKTKGDLLNEIKVKNCWKGSGSNNSEFSRVPIMKGMILNEWLANRCVMPTRSYLKPKGVPGIKGGGAYGRDFGDPGENSLPVHFKEHMQVIKRNHKDYAERPAKHGDFKEKPRILDDKFRGMSQSRIGKEFQYSEHTSWESFLYKKRRIYNTARNVLDRGVTQSATTTPLKYYKP